MKTIILKTTLLFLFMQFSVAGTGKITGTVQDTDSKKYLADVIVKIQGTDISDKTDDGGAFLLNHLEPGKYYLILIKSGYYSLVIPDVLVKDEDPVLLKAEMYPGDEKQFLFLEIGGIQVTADRELLSEEAQTVHKISAGEIEHMQASSLADVLELIPGSEKTGNLGLQSKQVVSLRGIDDASYDNGASFGTKIIVDDVPLSNNANLQTGVGVNYGSQVQATAGLQYDLREVVAENLEKVEVQSGASSVEYGDHTAGLVIVNTKTRNVPTRLKIKHNPDTQESNLMGSFYGANTDFVYNFNYGYSERDIRKKGDEYHRISGSLKADNNFWNNKLSFKQSLKYRRKIEEDGDDSDPDGKKAYNRDHHLTYSQQYNFASDAVSKFYWRNYIDYTRRNSWVRQKEANSPGYQTNLTSEGTILGIAIDPTYFSEVRTIGDEWNYGSKFKWERKAFSGPLLHRVLSGAEFQTDKNTGPGKTFDMLYPPNGKANTRPRSFNDIPGTTQLALFAEDRVSGDILIPFTLDFGFRFDSYNPTAIDVGALFSGRDVFKAKQGSFFNPRIGLKLKPFRKTQLRFSFGKSSKTPALSMIYPELFYQDSFGSMDTVLVPPDTMKWAVISTQIYDRVATKLKGYQSTKYEISLDQQIGQVGLSFSAYFKETKNIPRFEDVPYEYDRYHFPNWPDTTGKELLETVLVGRSAYDIARNVRATESSGFELSLKTHRIPALNMRFRVNAAFTYTKYLADNSIYYSSSSRSFSMGDTLSSGWVVPRDMQIIPYYGQNLGWKQRAIINYNVDYIAKPLGIWLTLKAQQVLWQQGRRIYNIQTAALGYYENGQNIEIDAETSRLMGIDKTYQTTSIVLDDTKTNDNWLFSIVLSKAVFKGAEVSLFVENIFNDPAYYINQVGNYTKRNPDMFWGIAFSSKLDDLF